MVKDAEVSPWQFSKMEAFSRSKEKKKLRLSIDQASNDSNLIFPDSVSALCISWDSEERWVGDCMIGAGCSGKLGV